MAAISQTTFWSAFSWIKMYKFRLKFHWILFLRVQQYSSIGSDDGLASTRRQAIIWTNDGLVYWCICASLSLNELTKPNMILSERCHNHGVPRKQWVKKNTLKNFSITYIWIHHHCGNDWLHGKWKHHDRVSSTFIARPNTIQKQNDTAHINWSLLWYWI